jgi:hypothetical protein
MGDTIMVGGGVRKQVSTREAEVDRTPRGRVRVRALARVRVRVRTIPPCQVDSHAHIPRRACA